jgi:hypothetical protein
MFIVALFIKAKEWKHSKCLPTDEWINKMWYQCEEYHFTIKILSIDTSCNVNLPKKHYIKWKTP